jgi:hypothetical protein
VVEATEAFVRIIVQGQQGEMVTNCQCCRHGDLQILNRCDERGKVGRARRARRWGWIMTVLTGSSRTTESRHVRHPEPDEATAKFTPGIDM